MFKFKKLRIRIKIRKKKIGPLAVFFISKTVGKHFWPRLMAGGRD
jgi:hypothetical protein